MGGSKGDVVNTVQSIRGSHGLTDGDDRAMV